MEETMKKLLAVLLLSVVAVAVVTTRSAMAQEQPEKMTAKEKEARWHGIIVRDNQDTSSLDVRRQGIEKRIYYDSSTRWTEGTKPADRSEFKSGVDVICLGKYDESKQFHATRIDLRRR
jgi:Ni/Co efflux regulator RcnB